MKLTKLQQEEMCDRIMIRTITLKDDPESAEGLELLANGLFNIS